MIDFAILEDRMREHLNEVARRRMAVLDPVKLVIDGYPEGKEERMEVPDHPQKPDWGRRQVPLSRELWIEREDYEDSPPKGFFRLFPGNEVRLRYGYVVKCVGMKDGVVHCTHYPDSRSGSPGAEKYKVKGNIHWVSARHAHAAKVHLYDRLFRRPSPARTANSWKTSIPTRAAPSKRRSSRAWGTWSPASPTSSSATATSSPTTTGGRSTGR